MSTEENTWGLARDLIPWGPTIDQTRCRGSSECVRFCPNNVFELNRPSRQARVARFHQCTILCSNCVVVCPNGAISFPSQDEFLDRVQELRQQQASSISNH
jgi:NAD-dependent dihydropyrimidine dehydrogenase PreA subunit